VRLGAALLALLLGAAPAAAADGAAFNVLGYSPDSRYFAFEQYGVQDGSGFPYWDVFMIDLKTNEWVAGTPARALVENEEARPSEARDRAMATATPVLKDKNISEPAEIIAANPATELVADRSRITFDRWYRPMGAKPGDAGSDIVRHELVLETLPLPRAQGCDETFGANLGFRLLINDLRAGTARTLHEDTAIPASRNCPLGYDLTAVVAQAGFPVTDRLVAIIGVYSVGFEGANHRFIAVPFSISD
jgi:predicted secreted protein